MDPICHIPISNASHRMIITVCASFFIRRLGIIIFSKNFLCAELGSNQQSPIPSRTEVGLRILLLRQLKAARETVAPIVRVLLYYPPPRANPGRLYHLSTDTYISKIKPVCGTQRLREFNPRA